MEGKIAVTRAGLIAESCYVGSVCVWDSANAQKSLRLEAFSGTVSALTFSADGRLLAAGDRQGAVRMWSMGPFAGEATALKKGGRLGGHAGEVLALNFSPDGELLTSASYDGSLQLWEVASDRPLGLPWKPGAIGFPFFSGKAGLAIWSGRDSGLYDLRLERQIARVCEMANRNLTPEEWRQYVSASEPYRKTCSGF